MKIQYASDLHLEFPENKKYMESHPLQPTADILILAGDIVPFAVMDKYKDFFDYLDTNWKHVYWIPGNHEYYNSDINFREIMFEEGIREHVKLLNNKVATYGNVRIIFSTLWSHISPANEIIVSNQLNDFRTIRDRSQYLTTEKYNSLHRESLNFIKTMFKVPHKGKTVVVTHHVPTFMHYPEAYKGDALNEAFATELFANLLKNTNPKHGFLATTIPMCRNLKLEKRGC